MSASSPDEFSIAGRFVNDCETAVIDSLLGLLLSNPNVGLLDFGKVVVRRNYANTDTVRIISGGASGHDPAHAGFVGKGMLTACVQGDVFCSPTLSDILRTLKELNYKHDSGILVIAQNNTADRLNFGLAVERARSQGIAVEMLVVSDDCCIVDQHQGKRGSSGIILVNKIAGAMAEQGRSLEEIFAFCQKARDNMSSILFSLRPASSPTMDTSTCVKHMGDEMEIGSGLHGETGLKTIQKLTVADTCRMLVADTLSENFVLNSTTPVAVLINNLGTMLQMEELIFVKEFVNHLQELEIPVARVYHGHFLTALDMKGFSVTILNVSEPPILEYLDAPCEAFAWGHTNTKAIPKGLQERIPSRVVTNGKRSMPPGLCLQEEEANIVLLALQFACDALISCEKQINTIDSESGRGNMGTKIKRGAETILIEAKKKTLDYHHPRIFFASLSIIAEKMITGTLGFLYSILFEAAANTFRKLPQQHYVNVDSWFNCLKKAIEVLESCVKVEFGYGTMYDPLYSCSLAMEEALKNDYNGLEAFGLGVSAAENAAIQTRKLNKRYPDPGAHVIGIWMRAVYEGIKMRCGD